MLIVGRYLCTCPYKLFKDGGFMRILFCRVTWMEKYIGREFEEDEMPYTGGKYMSKDNIGGEEWNFLDVDGYCYGFVDTKFNKGKKNALHIERIDESFKNLSEINNVLVVWVSKNKYGKQKIIGWYKNATVYREYQLNPIRYYGFNYDYNIVAKAEDCTLLPIEERTFEVPVAMNKKVKDFGFGQANVWYANEKSAKKFIDSVLEYIENYKGKRINKVYTEELEDMVEIDETKIDDILDEIDSLIYDDKDLKKQEDYLKCLKVCNSVLKIDPKNERAFLYKLYSLMSLYKIKKAIKECENNLSLFQDIRFEIENILGVLDFLNDNIDKAIKNLKNLANEYKRSEIYLNLANIYEYLKDYDKAKIWYEKILEIDDKNIEAYFRMASLEYEVKGNYKKALHYIDKIVEIENQNVHALYIKAWILNDLGKKEEALKIINQALEIDSNNTYFEELKKNIEVQ